MDLCLLRRGRHTTASVPMQSDRGFFSSSIYSFISFVLTHRLIFNLVAGNWCLNQIDACDCVKLL